MTDPVDQKFGLSADEAQTLLRLVYSSSFMGAWYLVNKDKQGRVQTIQTFFETITSAGLDSELVDSMQDWYWEMEPLHCGMLRAEGLGDLRIVPTALTLAAIVVLIWLLATT